MCHGSRRFDGDGMLHAVRIKAGKASYSNAYVQTSLLKQEKKAGKPLKLQACPSRTLTISCMLHMTAFPVWVSAEFNAKEKGGILLPEKSVGNGYSTAGYHGHICATVA